jgi:hypothetical protein
MPTETAQAQFRLEQSRASIRESAGLIANCYCAEDDVFEDEKRRLIAGISNLVLNLDSRPAQSAALAARKIAVYLFATVFHPSGKGGLSESQEAEIATILSQHLILRVTASVSGASEAMRRACIDKVKEMSARWSCDLTEGDFDWKVETANEIAAALETVEPKEGENAEL